MPEVGRDDPEYWLKMLMGLAIEAHRLGEKLRDEELLYDPDGSVRQSKIAVYSFECDCNYRNVNLIQSTTMRERQRKLMKLRYLKKRAWKDIFRIMDTTLRYSYDIHKNALQRVLRQNSGIDYKSEYLAERARLDSLNPYNCE